MDKKKLHHKIAKILVEKFKIKKNEINLNTDVTKFKNWDSLKHLSFIICLENEFKVKFLSNENFNCKKINKFLNIISNRL
jgi:acyl carrier protein|tara:strand:- start:355 stop:594 length:240 start_codon:yes stop_codon:yes gene_type:complete